MRIDDRKRDMALDAIIKGTTIKAACAVSGLAPSTLREMTKRLGVAVTPNVPGRRKGATSGAKHKI